MIISCPSCQASFRVDATRLGPDGKKVRCSKCGNVWLAVLDPSAHPEAAAPEEAVSAQSTAKPDEGAAAVSPAERPARTFTARDDGEGDPDSDSPGRNSVAEGELEGSDGLTDEQRARLAAARGRKQPRGAGFWIKVLAVFVVVAGFLVVAQKMGMVPSPGSKKPSSAVEKPVGNEAPGNTAPGDESGQKGGHIVGGPLPENTDQSAQ